MKEKLIIRNFGPIKEVDLDLGKVTVLIGEQATGKSTVAKVLAVCRYFSYIVKGVNTFNDFFDGPFFIGLQEWGLEEFINPDSYISYNCLHYSLTIKASKIHFNEFSDEELDENGEPNIDENVVEQTVYLPELISLSKEFNDLLIELKEINVGVDTLIVPNSFFINVKNVIDNPFYMPTERGLQSIFSLGQTGIRNLQNFLFNYFSKVDGILKNFKTETDIEPLGIVYLNKNGIGYVKKKEEKDFHLLSNAASGYQSTIPIVLVMKYYNEKQKKSKTLLIEEPELNLFPSAQNRLMQYFVEQMNKYNNNLLFTTQSPYILTSLNNLIYAYEVGKSDADETSKIIDKKYWLNPDVVSAYMMKSDGTVEDIFDREEAMIQAEKIDKVSSEINGVFDELLNIEFKENELNT